MNDTVVSWCRSHDVEVTRSRAYKKNDQAFVEQNNGAIVRRLVGYGRFEGIDAARSLARLFAAARLHINFFQPSFKLKDKHREGAKVISVIFLPLLRTNEQWSTRISMRHSNVGCGRFTARLIRWHCWHRCGTLKMSWASALISARESQG
ncbi:transposase family protein [Bradyrhizobium forestalis]|uniref:transposase family protein n=1 Tax=Bradyrhizobium forestalis TaxID=1419263 RepID=UPI0011AF61CE|nr:transposase family protein [Bradyrhizobium forestalis]